LSFSMLVVALLNPWKLHTDGCHGLSLISELTAEEVGFAYTQDCDHGATKDRNFNDAQKHSDYAIDAFHLAHCDVCALYGFIQVLILFSSLPVNLKNLVPGED
jgi:hypothetical protein